jgi:hypothetical protein
MSLIIQPENKQYQNTINNTTCDLTWIILATMWNKGII